MTNIILILSFSILTLSFSNQWFSPEEKSRKNDEVLVLYYHVDHKITVLKDYEDINKRFRYLSVNPCPGPLFIDGMLVVEGHLAVTDSSKVIFYGQCDVLDITIPFAYEVLKIDRIVNDSIAGFIFNKQKHILEPGKEFIDSIISIDKEGERIIRNTAIFHLENHGLINKASIIDYNELLIKEERTRDSIEMEEIKKLIEEK